MQSTIHRKKADRAKIETAKDHIPEEYKDKWWEEHANNTLYSMEKIDLDDILEKVGDSDEMSARIFESFKEYIDRKAKKISEYFKEGYFS